MPLQDGRIVIADEGYIRDSILLPNAQISAGYEPVMPSFQGHITEEEFQRKKTELLNGTMGPAIGVLGRLSGPMEGRGPTVGVRFRRDTKKRGSLGLQIDYAPLRVTTGCSSNCEPYAVLFAPTYEPSLYPAWGRIYAGVGFLLAGFPSLGADRGMAQGAHGGLGADIFSGPRLMVNVNARVLWFQRKDPTNRNVFVLQTGVSLSPRLEHHAAIESR